MPDHVKEYSFDVIKFTMRANESCFDEFKFCKTLMKVFRLYQLNVYSYTDILVEDAFHAVE